VIAAARIRRLPQVVADAIAAGEVIERPASVVKELMENAIDSGARRIDIDVDGGGLVRIRVVDDGGGIAEDDLGLAVTRHATSKISDAADLAAIATLGFRGEALASIAAVADVRIASRSDAAPTGSSIRVSGGQMRERSTSAVPVGTSVEVCELFAATPARLRFLKATATEAASAVRVASDLALTHPEISVTVRTDGKVALRSPGGSLRDSLRAVFGARADRDLVPVEAAGDITVTGAISAPHAHRGGRSGLVLVVNGRRVHNRALVYAVEEAYRGLIPAGRHPFGVLIVAVDPAVIDVNVHPTKREVRFTEERAAFAAVQRACWEALRAAPVAGLSPGAATGIPSLVLRGDASLHDGDPSPAYSTAAAPSTSYETSDRPMPDFSLADLAPLHSLGQSGGEWIVATGGGAVVLVDPHAAHEKVLYAELLASWSARESPDTQLLLLPAVIECDAARMEAWEHHADEIERCGFSVEQFGPGLLRCTGIPPISGGADVTRLVTDLLDTLLDSEGAADARRHRLAALVACHSAVRFGDRLDGEAQQRMLDRLVATPGGMTCPHGRPTVLVLRDDDLRRAFRRPLR
jgi:DNA mismatch repair protein MutL